ncbi:hypothetical protein GJ496_005086 [Pomphorhynchus laevis]|nr:hypothetical protein GJ496_005086 [Pomphorhynchus laevis]
MSQISTGIQFMRVLCGRIKSPMINLANISTDVDALQLDNDFKRGIYFVKDFITEEESSNLIKEINPLMRRRRYEYDHWDNAICGYKELERSDWSMINIATINRLRNMVKGLSHEDEQLIPQVHVLDVAADGIVKPHVDSIRVYLTDF